MQTRPSRHYYRNRLDESVLIKLFLLLMPRFRNILETDEFSIGLSRNSIRTR